MFLYGECDAEGTKKAINEFAQLIPDSKVLKIRNAGHFSAIENPTQFNAEVLKFCGNIQKRNRKP